MVAYLDEIFRVGPRAAALDAANALSVRLGGAKPQIWQESATTSTLQPAFPLKARLGPGWSLKRRIVLNFWVPFSAEMPLRKLEIGDIEPSSNTLVKATHLRLYDFYWSEEEISQLG